MKDIQQSGIAVHEHDLKNPEEPLLFQYRTDILEVSVGIQTRGSKVFHCAIDGTDRYEGTTAV